MKKKQILSALILSSMTILYVAPCVGQETNYSNNLIIKDFISCDVFTNNLSISEESNKVKALGVTVDAVTYDAAELDVVDVIEVTSSTQLETENIKEDSEFGEPLDNDIVIYTDGWINANTVNVRELPDITSNVIDILNYGDKIRCYQLNEKWCGVEYNGTIAYIYASLISNSEMIPLNYQEYTCPSNKRMSWMPYQAITSKSSPQYKLQKIAYTGEYGVRQVNGRFCIAVGSAYTTQIGTYIDLVLENGTVIPCILGDCKADIHTDSSNRVSQDGSLAEFIVDKSSLGIMTKKMGCLEYACDEWNSKVVRIRIYDIKEEF